MNAACLRAYLGGGRDEEAPAGEDPPLDVGQVVLAHREQVLSAGLGRAGIRIASELGWITAELRPAGE